MYINKKIKSIVCLVAVSSLASFAMHANAQTNTTEHDYTKIDKKITIGFETGKAFSFHLFTPSNTKQKKNTVNSKSLIVRLAFTDHIKIQTGLNYSVFKQPLANNNGMQQTVNPFDLAVPATIEYHFFKKGRRLRPYAGAGIQYSIGSKLTNNSVSKSDFQPNYVPQNCCNPISIIFTQGVIFEINTKIQVTQSFHFNPASGIKTIGLDLGIGFTLP